MEGDDEEERTAHVNGYVGATVVWGAGQGDDDRVDVSAAADGAGGWNFFGRRKPSVNGVCIHEGSFTEKGNILPPVMYYFWSSTTHVHTAGSDQELKEKENGEDDGLHIEPSSINELQLPKSCRILVAFLIMPSVCCSYCTKHVCVLYAFLEKKKCKVQFAWWWWRHCLMMTTYISTSI